jgi:iron-sulfur cluster assembly accessory protein
VTKDFANLDENLKKLMQNSKKPIKFLNFETHSLKITSECLKKILEFQSENQVKLIRILIEGGGCQGFQYKFLEDEISKIGIVGRDIVLCQKISEKESAQEILSNPIIVFDLFSEFYIKDSTFDFENSLLFRGFAIKNNPKVKASCGCKKSFSSDEFFDENLTADL